MVSKERLNSLPRSPGVYLMKDSGGDVIYIGKAINLKNRVRSYFGKGDGRYSVAYIREKTVTVETLVTENERQALVLESDLIKKYKPRYNIRLKDDKAHLLIRIDTQTDWPRLEFTRYQKDDGAKYIGPFPFSYNLRTVLDVIKRSVPLRTCSDRMMKNRVRPCLEYQIKRCSGPCCIDVDPGEYQDWVKQAIRILQGETAEVVVELERNMELASEQLRFEDAVLYRDRIETLKKIFEQSEPVQFTTGATDCFGIYREGQNLELSVLKVRQGRLFESKTYGFSEVDGPSEEILSSALMQFYSKIDFIPEQILLPIEIDSKSSHEEIYSEKRQGKVELKKPLKGAKARLLVLANQNAKQNFEARFSDVSKSDRLLKALQAHLKLVDMPRVIECADISHFQGGQTVGSVVCFKDAKPERSRYRTFKVSIEGKPDDFASMKEVVLRHLSRCAEENTLSDVMVIDGGKQQLNEAVKARNELGLSSPIMVGMAKKRTGSLPYFARVQGFDPKLLKKPERFFLEDVEKPVILNPQNEALHLMERIRNEAHRVAITFHRSLRKKHTLKSILDDLPGVGEVRKKLLLKEFKSIKKISEASAEDISERTNIPLKVCKLLKRALVKKEGQSDPTSEQE